MAALRLVALGDSLTQGFMSAAIRHTESSYPVLVAEALGIRPEAFRIPRIPGPGLPLNLEDLVRTMDAELGADIGPLERTFRVPDILHDYVDRVEDFYERGPGARVRTGGRIFHNLAVWGFTVADALRLTPAACRAVIEQKDGWVGDDLLGIPSAPMFRSALQVLPADSDGAHHSAIDALARLVASEGPPEVLLLWYGANDALGTVLDLEVQDMAEHQGPIPSDPVERRRHWNLTSAEAFADDYAELADRIDAAVGTATQVFVGTVPEVTIPPITRGRGYFDGRYFEAYTRFFVSEDTSAVQALTRADAQLIDDRIARFNDTIRAAVAARPNWHLADTAGALATLAVRRNGHDGAPTESLRSWCVGRGRPDHPLLSLDPEPSILMYETAPEGRRTGGGLISLDGIHPTTIGYGIVAELFLGEMQAAGVPGADPARLDWERVIARDRLLRVPLRTWDDLLRAGRDISALVDLVFREVWPHVSRP